MQDGQNAFNCFIERFITSGAHNFIPKTCTITKRTIFTLIFILTKYVLLLLLRGRAFNLKGKNYVTKFERK